MTAPILPDPTLLTLQAAVTGRYALERELGRGGMGIVFLARDLALERQVAIKLLSPYLAGDPIARERFLREARTAAALQHPHIVPIHSVDSSNDLLFFVMAYVEGETLAERVERRGVLAPREAMVLFQEVAWALGYAHGRGVVHRDIKPDNILLDAMSGRAMVTDFGIAHVDSRETLSSPGVGLGTVAYVSPEQAGGAPPDGRSDLYSLGATVYFALSGNSPVEAPTPLAMLARLMHEIPVPIAGLRPELPPAFAESVMRCLAHEPAERFDDAEALAGAVGEALTVTKAARPESREVARQAQVASPLLLLGAAAGYLATVCGLAGLMPAGVAAGMIAAGAGGVLFAVALALAALSAAARSGAGVSEIAEVLTEEIRDAEMARRGVYQRLSGGQRWGLRIMGLVIIALGLAELRVTTVAHSYPAGGWWFPALALMSITLGGYMVFALRGDTPPARRVGARGGLTDLASTAGLRLARWLLERSLVQHLTELTAPDPRASDRSAPTTTLLRHNVDDLLHGLPVELRDRLDGVGPLALRLEQAARELRLLLAPAEAALAAMAASDPMRPAAAAQRDRLRHRLLDCGTALESLRTGLLRMHAGLIETSALTADLERVREVSRQVEAELEVRQLLGGPGHGADR